jgi:hypothetical protein
MKLFTIFVLLLSQAVSNPVPYSVVEDDFSGIDFTEFPGFIKNDDTPADNLLESNLNEEEAQETKTFEADPTVNVDEQQPVHLNEKPAPSDDAAVEVAPIVEPLSNDKFEEPEKSDVNQEPEQNFEEVSAVDSILDSLTRGPADATPVDTNKQVCPLVYALAKE